VQASGVQWSFNISLQNIYTVLQKPPAYQSCGIFRRPQGAMTCEGACPFTGYGAHSALKGDGGTGSFCLLIPRPKNIILSLITFTEKSVLKIGFVLSI
jgi:hypothetical protein